MTTRSSKRTSGRFTPNSYNKINPDNTQNPTKNSTQDLHTLYTHGEVVWANSGSGYPTWPARIAFVPFQLNPNYKPNSILTYPLFLYGTHNLMWLQQDLINKNTPANYNKFSKKGKQVKNKETSKLFEDAIEEMENNPLVECDLQTMADLEAWLSGKKEIDVTRWEDEGLLNTDSLVKK